MGIFFSKHQKAFATFDQERMSSDMKYKTKSQQEHCRNTPNLLIFLAPVQVNGVKKIYTNTWQ